MHSLPRDLIFVVLKYLDEEGFKETLHKLEEESGLFFNIEYFQSMVLHGNWDKVEKYLSGFTALDDNEFSTKIFFEIRKQMYIEALDNHDQAGALNILENQLKVFATCYEDLYGEISQLVTFDSFRENRKFSNYEDKKCERTTVVMELKKLIEANPLFYDKLHFPCIRCSRLRTLVNQGLNWQHMRCKKPRINPEVKTLFVDHLCEELNDAYIQSGANDQPIGFIPEDRELVPTDEDMASPCICFNKDGTLLDVFTNNDAAKIVGTADGLRFLESNEHCSSNASDMMEAMKKLEVTKYSADATVVSAGVVEKCVPAVACRAIDGDTENLTDVIPRLTKEVNYNLTTWKLTEINDPAHCRSLRLHDDVETKKISRLIYTNAGNCIMALASNGIHLVWRWPRDDLNLSKKATTDVLPELWKPATGLLMVNDINVTNPEKPVHSFVLSKNDSYAVSSSGGKISLYNSLTWKALTKFMTPPPVATSLALHPEDNNVIAIGMNDSSIIIYHIRFDEILTKLMGHLEKITGLAFSLELNVLVSFGADNQIIVWKSVGWDKQNCTFLQIPWRRPTVLLGTSIQFHQDQIHFLVAHGTQLSIYETTKLECIKQWFPGESFAPISHATFSCDCQLVYSSFLDGTVGIFRASDLQLQCLVNPTAYDVEPLVIAAHPQEPNQFALGLSNGEVIVLEPLESESKWGLAPPGGIESTSTMSTASSVAASGSNNC